MPLPEARKDLITQSFLDDLVLYDPKNHQVHSLSPSAKALWKHLDGVTEMVEAQRSLGGQSLPCSEDDIRTSLKEMSEAGLLTTSLSSPIDRRQAIKAALMGVAVVSLLAPTPAMACSPTGSACTTNGQCCSGKCKGNHRCK